jgi:hypothetical protein
LTMSVTAYSTPSRGITSRRGRRRKSRSTSLALINVR